MLISKQWLKEFVQMPKNISDQELANTITLSTVEVEHVEEQSAAMDHMVVGEIQSVEAHPNADRLRVCQVDVGGRVTQIVCGGTNVRQGMKVAVALPGSRVRWHGEGEWIELTKTKIRGEESEGMICASAEIGLQHSTEGEHEILDLGTISSRPGTPLSEALGRDDVVFEIEHKSLTNRPDLMGHYGMAREIAAITRSPLKEYQPAKVNAGKGVSIIVDVEEIELCPRYMAVALEGIRVESSPEWLKRRLESCGVRSINTVVDVTNAVMLELGQPMHAFDANAWKGNAITIGVRKAKKGEKITCLDEKTYVLPKEALLITDGKNPLAIAGVMGGQGSGVGTQTTRIVFEAANFSAVSVRKTSQSLGLRSESSARFEKALDPNVCELALRRAVELTQELCPSARVCSAVVDEKKRLPAPQPISFHQELVNARLGASVEVGEMKDILLRLGFDVRLKKEVFTVIPPSWRATKDISIQEDVFEEIARVYGYEKIPAVLPAFTIAPAPTDRIRQLTRAARAALSVGCRATESYQYAFVRPETLQALGESLDHHIKLANPLAADRPFLVRSLIPNLLEALVRNQRASECVRLFEMERVFRKEEKGEEMGEGKSLLPGQPHLLTVAYTKKGDETPFWEARRMCEVVLETLGFSVAFEASKPSSPWQHPTRVAHVIVEGTPVGIVSEVDPKSAGLLGLDHRVSVFELNVDLLATLKEPEVLYEKVATHPSAERDISVVVDEKLEYVQLEQAFLRTSALLEDIELFDVYQGKGIEKGKKSLAMHLSFRDLDSTLSSEQVDAQMQALQKVLESSFNGIIRA